MPTVDLHNNCFKIFQQLSMKTELSMRASSKDVKLGKIQSKEPHSSSIFYGERSVLKKNFEGTEVDLTQDCTSALSKKSQHGKKKKKKKKTLLSLLIYFA